MEKFREWYAKYGHRTVSILLFTGILVSTLTLILTDANRIYFISFMLLFQFGLVLFWYFFYRKRIAAWTLKRNVFVKHAASIYPGIAAFLLIFF